jgi:peptide/nickel transport system permease protein
VSTVGSAELQAAADTPRGRGVMLPPVAAFLIRRVVRGILVLLVLSILAFAMVRLLPGSPVVNLAGPYSTAAQRARLTQQLGLNGPLITQYLRWAGNALQGNFGTSIFYGVPVSQLISQRLPNTLELAVVATVISFAWGVPFGALAALRRGKLIDRAVRSVNFLGMATPVFAFGVALVLLFTVVFSSWPTLGFVPFTQDPGRNLESILLPAIAMGLPLGSTVCRFMRSAMLEVYEQDYIRTALASGSSRLSATVRHGLRNAAGPVVTIGGLQLAGLVGQSVLVENVFAIPGIGQLTVTAILQRDYPVIQACILLLGAVYVVMNLIVDFLYPLIDPRLGHGS